VIELRPDQAEHDATIDQAFWLGARNVLSAYPTGGGKSVMMAHRANKHKGASALIAHRQELVSQISLALGRFGLRHRIIAPESVVRNIVGIHMAELNNRSFYDPLGRVAVAGVDTLIRRDPSLDPWFQQVTLWQMDEAHHIINNKWGKATEMFPNALGIGWTATPGRADGKGLGRGADGLMDVLVMGPDMRTLINKGLLTEYRVFCPRTEDLDLRDVPVTASGDYSPEKLRKAVHQSRIIGDVVKHYLRIAPGKRGVTFAVDIEDATKITQAFRAANVPAELVTGETPDAARAGALRRLRSGDILQLVNVDLFGEGFDLPAIEVVSFARPTMSYTLYAQQFGRALRTLGGKQYGFIIDHVGNVLKHGLPDGPRNWSLDRRASRSKSISDSVDPVRTCPNCTSAYPRRKTQCPYCGHVPMPSGRSSPDQVDGDLTELDPTVLRIMRGELDRVDGPSHAPGNVNAATARAIHSHHLERQKAQQALRATIALWGGWRKHLGESDREAMRRFFFTFGTDTMSACLLGVREADELRAIVADTLRCAGVTAL
jgi:superfamily II DNA or RNA helicase